MFIYSLLAFPVPNSVSITRYKKPNKRSQITLYNSMRNPQLTDPNFRTKVRWVSGTSKSKQTRTRNLNAQNQSSGPPNTNTKVTNIRVDFHIHKKLGFLVVEKLSELRKSKQIQGEKLTFFKRWVICGLNRNFWSQLRLWFDKEANEKFF